MTTPQPDEEAVFQVARQIGEAAARAAYLDQFCGTDSHLRERVDALLLVHEHEEDFLKSNPDASSTVEHARITEGPGTKIGRYKLLQKIGEGGFGVVYMAEQEEPVHRRVALKIIKPGMDSGQVIARFEAERQALAMMDHPNIAKVLDAGTTQSGRPYFVMELVHGIPITKYCDDNCLSPRERLALFIPVCHAIQHAHQKGIIHRDVKPSNVLVCLYDGDPVPKVIDFGVAKAIQQKLTKKTMFTQFGQVIGTLEYMSPEQAEMNQLDIDTRSDVYSLGTVLYELLTGTTPFEPKRLRTVAFDEMLRIIREEDPPRPSLRLSTTEKLASISAQRQTEPARLSRLVRGELDWIVMKALEKQRSRRYESASGLAKDIERYLADQPVEARAPSASYKLRKFLRRNKAPVLVATGVAALLVAGSVISTWLAIRASRAETVAEERRAAAEKAEGQARDERNTADKARQRAEQSEATAQHHLYIANMHRIPFELDNNNVVAARALLDLYRPGNGGRVQPGWEWFYWDRVCHAELLTLKGHPSQIMDVAYSPDGSLLATAGGDSDPVVKIWDSLTGTELHALHGHEYIASQIAFSPDGKLLATCGGSHGTVKLWDVATWSESSSWKPEPDSWFAAIDFSPDGTMLALSDLKSKRVRFWDLVRETWVGQLPEGTETWRIQYSPDGNTIAAVKSDGVQLWDVNKTTLLRTFTGHSFVDLEQGGVLSESITGLAFSPDGLLIATCSRDGTVKIRKVLDGTEVRSITVESATLQSSSGLNDLAFSPDGRFLVTAGVNTPLMLWEVQTGRELRKYYGSSYVDHVAFSPDGTRLASTGRRGEFKIWDVAGEPGQHLVLNEMFYTHSPTFSPNGRLLAERFPYGFRTGQVRVSDAETGRLLLRLDHGVYAHVTAFDFSSDGARIAAASFRHDPDTGTSEMVPGSSEVRVWDLKNQQLVGAIAAFVERINQVAFSPDDQFLATVATTHDPDTRKWRGEVKLWDTKTWKELRSFSGTSMAFSPNGTALAVLGNDESVALFNLRTGNVLSELPNRQGRWGLCFSPDGNQLCDGSAVWDVADGRRACILAGNNAPAKFSPDGRRLFSLKATSYASSGLLQVWDAATGDLLTTIPVQAASGVSLHADGRRCAVSGIPTGTWIVDARPLTSELRSKLEAQNLVAHLVRQPLLKDEIHDRLRKMKTIGEAVRREALALAANLEPPSDLLALAAWEIVQYPDRSEDQYLRAVRWLEEANQVPPKNSDVLGNLGLALYRLGRFEEAVANLESAYKINMSGYYGPAGRDLVGLAMAQYQLGRIEEARETLARSRDDWGHVPPHLIREAEMLIEGTMDEPNK
jgi:WD40 repeat protein/serine/threonine protein kinase